MSSYPTQIIVPIAVAIVMYYLNKQSQKDASVDADGNTVLLLPVFYGVLGIAAAGLGCGLLVFGLINYNADDIKPLFGLFLLFAGLGTPFILYRYVYRVILTPQSLVHRNLIGKYKSLDWADITMVNYSAAMMNLKVSDGNSKVSCYAHLVGFKQLVSELEECSGKTRAEMGIPVL